MLTLRKWGGDMKIGENIRHARQKAGLTQKELGEKLGISQAAVGQFESDKANPKIETLLKIATALNIQLSELVPMNNALDWTFEKIEENRIVREYSAIDMAIKDNLDKMNESAKKKVYNYTEDLVQNSKNWIEKQ